ncbi:MAG: DoxX family protein [Proteobacteria bacterium]|nr:DoxX family protein [Pseudomonadota bacterium]
MIGLAVALFHAIVFLQSGLDKVFDWKGNLEFMTGHFSNSPLAGPVAPLLAVVTVAEVGAGALSAAGAVGLLLGGQGVLAFWGALLAAVSLLMVLFGQRMAKAYADAAVIAPYFLVACLGIWILGS